jgi:hypothetical protein
MMKTPMQRAKNAAEAVVAYHRKHGSSDDLETCTIDLIADLKHLAARRGWSWAAMEKTAATYVQEELDKARGKRRR